MNKIIKDRISDNILIMKKILENDKLIGDLETAANAIIKSYKNKGKIFFCGNGGSAADSQHLAAELVSKFYLEREALAAEALSVNTSVITSVSNDNTFDNVFSRQIDANGKKGDVLVGLSTSGKSVNVVKALNSAKSMGLFAIGFTGEKDGPVSDICDICIKVPSDDTPRIQEAHILLGHILCELVESNLFSS